MDPDGHLIGKEPIEAFCEEDTGTTSVGEVTKVNLTACEGDVGCSKIKIVYPQPMQQLKALIDISESCSQTIKFKCFGSPLKTESRKLGYWLDNKGKSKNSM